MTIEFFKAGPGDQDALGRMMQFSRFELTPPLREDIDRQGLFPAQTLQEQMEDEANEIFILLIDGRLGGFFITGRDGAVNVLHTLYIMPKYRRRKVGTHVAARVFEQRSGEWRVGSEPCMPGTAVFLRAVLEEYMDDRYSEQAAEKDGWTYSVFSFSNAKNAR